MKPHLIFIGPPGSGKGTQSKSLSLEHGYFHFSTGDILREEIAKNTEAGNKIAATISQGHLVDDGTMCDIIEKAADLDTKLYVFDGFPRTENQASMLSHLIRKAGHTFKIFVFNVDPRILAERVENRRICSKCGAIFNLINKPPIVDGKCDACSEALFSRPDDTREVIEKRLEIFKETAAPIIKFYENTGEIVINLNAMANAEDVKEKIYQELDL